MTNKTISKTSHTQPIGVKMHHIAQKIEPKADTIQFGRVTLNLLCIYLRLHDRCVDKREIIYELQQTGENRTKSLIS